MSQLSRGGLRSFCTCSARLQSSSSSTAEPAKVRRSTKPVSTSDSFKTPTLPAPKKKKSSSSRKGQVASLPHTELFRGLVGTTPIAHRPTLINEDSARDLVREWGIDKMHDATVLEVYPGPGGITRALLELKNVKKVIAIEEAYRYQPMLEAAAQRSSDPSRLSIVQHDAFVWEAYSKVEQQGLLKDVAIHPWEEVHPNFFLAFQMPNTRHAEQQFVQFLATSATRKMWLWKYGRFQMGFLGANAFWSKILAEPGTSMHHKLAVLMPSIGKIERLSLMSGLSPVDSHFHRPRGDPALFSPVKVTPHANAAVKNYEVLEYVTRCMFVAKAQPWSKAIAGLAAGATNLIPELIKRGMPALNVPVNDLKLEDWANIANVYDEWPFKSDVLFDDAQFTSSSF